jgi:MFS family permease
MKKVSQFNLFRALASRNFTLYLTGRAVSQFGTWMQRTAVVWVVYTMTHSAFLIGVAMFAEQFPSFIFSIPGGVAADRYSRYTIIKITQVTSMMQSVLLAVLVITGHAAVWAILLLSVILGIINAFDVPARQALIHDVVSTPDDLPNALSLSTATASLAQLLGPALSGIILNAYGAGVCFLLNAASFGGVIVSLLLMHLKPYQPKKTNKKVAAEFAEGFAYVRHTPGIGHIVAMLALISLLVLPYNTVLPVFAKVVFEGDASTFGYINSFVGIGAVLGTMFLASRKPGANLKKMLFFSCLLMGMALIGFSQFRNFPTAMFFVAITGYGSMAQFTISNILVQSAAAPEMRGRTMGILLMAIFGMMPLGSLLTGAVSEHIGAPATVLAQGIIAVVVALAFVKFLTAPPTVSAKINEPII